MQTRIETLSPKKLMGMRMNMSFANNRTTELWRGFMQRRTEIQNKIGTDLYSLQNYPPHFFDNFNPNAEFEKWAAIEVSDFSSIPDGMEPYTLLGGLYAVFLYKGSNTEAGSTFQYIFGTWLPNSGYSLDNRSHFEILGEKYKNNDPNSEEEIWIPIL
jgi:AraC family transcriptional regulator